MKRGGYLKTYTPINPINEERQEREQERQFGELAEYVRGLGCLVCGGPSQACHFKTRRNGGAWRIVFCEDTHEPIEVGNLWPGCPRHHREQHDRGILTFQATHGLDLDAETRRIGAEYLDGGAVASSGLPW